MPRKKWFCSSTTSVTYVEIYVNSSHEIYFLCPIYILINSYVLKTIVAKTQRSAS